MPLSGAGKRLRDTPQLFWSRVNQSGGPDSCWPWLGQKNRAGYGVFERGNSRYGNRRVFLAHRHAFQLTYGAIPPDRPNVCHSCDNPPCCNPAHLFSGTQLDNIADMTSKGRAAWHNKRMPAEFFPRGEAHGNARLTAESVREIRARVAAGEPQGKVAAQFGIHQVTISKVALRKLWGHVA